MRGLFQLLGSLIGRNEFPLNSFIQLYVTFLSIQAGYLLPEADYLLYNKKSATLKKFLQPTRREIEKVAIDEFSSDGSISSASSNQLISPVKYVSPMREVSPSKEVSPTKEVSLRKPMAKTNDPKFLSEFYANSRLHFISALAQEKKTYVNKLREAADSNTFPGIERLRDKFAQSKEPKHSAFTGQLIMHIDMDCFFASVGRRLRPELQGI